MARVDDIRFAGHELPSAGDMLHGADRLKQWKIGVHMGCRSLVLGNNKRSYFIPVRVEGSQLLDQSGIAGGSLHSFPPTGVGAGLVQRVEA